MEDTRSRRRITKRITGGALRRRRFTTRMPERGNTGHWVRKKGGRIGKPEKSNDEPLFVGKRGRNV